MEDYFNDPSVKNLNYLKNAVETSLSNSTIRDKLKELESQMKVFKDFFQANGIDKADMCNKLQTTPYTMSRDCFCAGEPFWYCDGIMIKEMTDFINSKGESYFTESNATSSRKKRATACEFGYGAIDLCGSFECCNNFGPVDLCVGAEACANPDPLGSETINNHDKANFRLPTVFSIYGKLCIAVISDILSKSHLDQIINWDGCFLKVSVNIYIIRSQATLEVELNFLLFKVVATLSLQYARPVASLL